jgi:hypothetical protein
MYSDTIQNEVCMKATVVDLRYHMNEVLKALDRNENVSVLYHGKVKGVITPVNSVVETRIAEHPFFGMRSSTASVDQVMSDLRGGRYRDL